MTTGSLRINRDIVLTMKRQSLRERLAKNPMQSVLALAQMQARPRDVLNYVEDDSRITVIGQITRTQPLFDPVASGVEMLRDGADALSFFTDHAVHQHDLEDMWLVARGLGSTPIIYQNYVLSEYHVMGIRVADASGIIINSAIVDAQQLRTIVTSAQRWRMTIFIEIESVEQAAIATALSPHVICVGERCGKDVEDACRALQAVAEHLPHHTKRMLSLTLHTLDEVELAIQAGANAVIVSPGLLKQDQNRRLPLLTRRDQA